MERDDGALSCGRRALPAREGAPACRARGQARHVPRGDHRHARQGPHRLRAAVAPGHARAPRRRLCVRFCARSSRREEGRAGGEAGGEGEQHDGGDGGGAVHGGGGRPVRAADGREADTGVDARAGAEHARGGQGVQPVWGRGDGQVRVAGGADAVRADVGAVEPDVAVRYVLLFLSLDFSVLFFLFATLDALM